MLSKWEPTTLRERRKKETREQVRRVALELIQDRGYDSVTVELISEHAGISVRTFFNYFPNKESAMIATPPPLAFSAMQDFLLADGGPHDLFADLAELAISQLADVGADPSEFESSMQIVMAVPALAKLQLGVFVELETQFTELIAVRLNLDPDDERPTVIAAAFMAAVRVAGQHLSRNPDRRTLAEEIRECLNVLSAGESNLTP